MPLRGILYFKPGIGIEEDEGALREILEHPVEIIHAMFMRKGILVQDINDDILSLK